MGKNIHHTSARFVPPLNLHITLVFLGYVNEQQEHILRKEASRVVMPKLTLVFDQLSHWKKSGVLCLTTSTACPELMRLVNALTLVAEKLEIDVDKRDFKPHVTLARKVSEPVVQLIEPIHWCSSSFCLVESMPMRTVSNYRIIEKWG